MVAGIVKDRKASLVIVGQAFSRLLEIVPFAREVRLAVCGGLVVRLLVREFPSTLHRPMRTLYCAADTGKNNLVNASLGGDKTHLAYIIVIAVGSHRPDG